jgi:hypothetical protein
MNLIESDWKHYSKIIDTIVEKYYLKLNLDIRNILEEKNQSEKEKKLKIFKIIDDADKLLDKSIYRHSRSSFYENVICLISNKIMSIDDIADFSEEFRDKIKNIISDR